MKGVATFPGMDINTAGSYTLTASDGNLTPATSPSFAITPAAASATKSTLAVSSSNVDVNGTATVTLQLKDAYGNNLTTTPTLPPLSGDWSTVFDDEFNGNSLSSVWVPHQWWDIGATAGEGVEESAPYDVSVSGGMLQLTAKIDNTYGTGYTSGLVQAGGIRGVTSRWANWLNVCVTPTWRREVTCARGN